MKQVFRSGDVRGKGAILCPASSATQERRHNGSKEEGTRENTN